MSYFSDGSCFGHYDKDEKQCKAKNCALSKICKASLDYSEHWKICAMPKRDEMAITAAVNIIKKDMEESK